MPRAPRRYQHGPACCYHLMNRGHNRETLFADDADRRRFLELVARYKVRFLMRVYHYCLMSNHFHLVVQLDKPDYLSPLVAGLLRSYVHYFHRRYEFVGHLWQGRFKSPAIDAECYLLSCGRYVERNPLEARLAKAPWDWPWSSAPALALGVVDPLVDLNPYYLELGAEPARRQARWREFLLGDDSKEEAVRRADWLIGDPGFRSRMQQNRPRPAPRRGGRPLGALKREAGPVFPQLLQTNEDA